MYKSKILYLYLWFIETETFVEVYEIERLHFLLRAIIYYQFDQLFV